MTARISTHIDLDEVEATPWACGPYARQALVTAARALIALVEKEGLDHYFELDDLNEPWRSAVAAIAPFRPEAPVTGTGRQDCPEEYDRQHVPGEAR